MKPTIKKKPKPAQQSLVEGTQGYDNKMLGVGYMDILKQTKVKPKKYNPYQK